MQVADYIANTRANTGVRHVHMLTGGDMFLNAALELEKRICLILDYREQACEMAAED